MAGSETMSGGVLGEPLMPVIERFVVCEDALGFRGAIGVAPAVALSKYKMPEHFIIAADVNILMIKASESVSKPTP